MPVELSVKDVRASLLRAASHPDFSRPSSAFGVGAGPGEGDPSTMLLGTLFHEVFADLVSRDPRRSGLRVLVEAGADRDDAVARLVRHAYQALVGPRLSRHQARLNETTPQVLTFWRAVQNLARWLEDLVAALRSRPDAPATWQSMAALISPEENLACELREPDWSDAVHLTGTVDSLIRHPAGDRFCALELKLGRAHPAVDLGQAALYRLIAARRAGGDGALALLHFAPDPEETVIAAPRVAEAEARLLRLIGRMAGVLRDGARPTPANGPQPAGATPASSPQPAGAPPPPRPPAPDRRAPTPSWPSASCAPSANTAAPSTSPSRRSSAPASSASSSASARASPSTR